MPPQVPISPHARLLRLAPPHPTLQLYLYLRLIIALTWPVGYIITNPGVGFQYGLRSRYSQRTNMLI